MKIKYIGGRSSFEVTLNRKAYYFNKENNRTLEINNQGLINYIFSLHNRYEFIVVDEDVKKEEVVEEVAHIEKIITKTRGRPKKKGGK